MTDEIEQMMTKRLEENIKKEKTLKKDLIEVRGLIKKDQKFLGISKPKRSGNRRGKGDIKTEDE